MSEIDALAARAGVDVEYVGWRGEPVRASRESLDAVLTALGHDTRDPGRAHADADAAWWDAGAPPVVTRTLALRVRADRDADWSIEIEHEDGGRGAAHGRLYDLPADGHVDRYGSPWCLRRIALDGPHGYHTVHWKVGDRAGRARWIAAPERAFGDDTRSWGVFAPLHALRSARSGGAGDLGELHSLATRVKRRGGRWIATLPLLAAFLDEPCEPSPYAPASRRMWNELFLDLDLGDGSYDPSAAERARLAAAPLVDYRAQYAWKRALLDQQARAQWARIGDELARFAAGEVGDYAAFRAIGEVQRTGWSQWPAALRDPPARLLGEADCDRERWRTHVYAQWYMDQQLRMFKDALYLDLPVGVNRDAWEVWRDRDRFVLGASTGAPPDALFLGGQDWGLPPLHPQRARAHGWDYVIACVRHHMRHAGMLRIDHVMGLHRLYWVPSGMRATEGVYVRYAADELYGIFVLESHRHRCALVGEDLGTVPPDVPPAMRRHNLAGLFVGEFAMPGPITPASSQVASMNTHDTATFAGWWQGADIDDKLALALIDEPQAVAERAGRADARDALGGDPTAALLAITREMAASASPVVLATLEDAWLEPRPQNVPGTSHQRPNWRRPFAQDTDAILADPRVDALFEASKR